MSLTPDSIIEKLPQELQSKIFNYLKLEDLFNVTLTSKLLKSTIEKNMKLMEKFNVKISKILTSTCISDRNYPNVQLDIALTDPQVAIIRASFANIRKSMKKLSINGNIPRNFLIPKSFCELCDSVEILSIISKEEEGYDEAQLDPIQDLSGYFPNLRHLNVYTDLYIENVPTFKQVNRVVMHDGVMFTFEKPFENIPNVERLVIFKSALPMLFYDTCWITELGHLNNLRVLILKDCGIGVSFSFKYLYILQLINCTFFTNEDASFLPKSCEIGGLHIEDCKECFLWIPKFLESESKVKHLELINLELPEKCVQLVDRFIQKCESYSIVDLVYAR